MFSAELVRIGQVAVLKKNKLKQRGNSAIDKIASDAAIDTEGDWD